MRKVFTVLLFLLASCSCGSSHRNGSFTIGYDEGWHEMNFMGQLPNVNGFARDLLKEIGKVKKMKLAMQPVNWDTLYTDLKANKYSAALTTMYPYIFNQASYDFSSPYLLTGPVLVLPNASKFTSIEQLGGKEIAFISGSEGDLILEKNPAILIRPYDSVPRALNDVADGVIDGAIVDVILASAYVQNIYNGRLIIATDPLNDQGLRLITPAGETASLVRNFDEGVEELKKKGTYAALLKKWSLGQGKGK